MIMAVKEKTKSYPHVVEYFKNFHFIISKLKNQGINA